MLFAGLGVLRDSLRAPCRRRSRRAMPLVLTGLALFVGPVQATVRAPKTAYGAARDVLADPRSRQSAAPARSSVRLDIVSDSSRMQLQPDQAARAVLERAIRAKGGADRLRGVRTVVATGTLTVRSPQPVQARTTAYICYPDRFRVDATLPNGEVTQVFAGGEAWRKDPSGVHDVDAGERDALRNNALRDLVSLLVRAADGRLQVRLVPDERGGRGQPIDTLRLVGVGMPPVDLLVDRTTGMIAAERYVVDQPGAIGKVPTEEWYSDYRDIGGVQVAFKTVVRRGEAVILERTLTAFEVNVPIDEQTFKRPA